MQNILKNKIVWIAMLVIILVAVFYLGLRSGKGTDNQVISPSNTLAQSQTQTSTATGDRSNPKTYAYTEAVNHLNEYAKVTGTVVDVYTSKSGTTFLDFCSDYKSCPFSVVIFASDATKFTNVKQYVGAVTVTGLIKSYQGKAEIILNGPDQIVKN